MLKATHTTQGGAGTRLPPVVAMVSDLTRPANPLRGGGGIAGDLLIILTIVRVALRSSPPLNMNLSSRQLSYVASIKNQAETLGQGPVN